MKRALMFFVAVFSFAIANGQTCIDTVTIYYDRATANYNYSFDTGYVNGPNRYTTEIGDNWDISTGQLTGVVIGFNLKQIIGSPDSIHVYVYNTNASDSLPTGSPIADKKISTADIDTVNFWNTIHFDSPVTVTRNYAITVQVTGAGIDDTVVVGASQDGDGLLEGRACMKLPNGNWYHMADVWNNFDVDLLMEPIVDRSFSAAATVDRSTACPGNTVNLTANTFSCTGNMSYSWSGPGITNASASTTTANIPTSQHDSAVYTLVVTDLSNSTTLTSSVRVLVNDIHVSAGNDTFIACGSNVDLHAILTGHTGPGTTIQWANGPSSLFYPQVGAGTYAVAVANATGCQANDTIIVRFPTSQSLGFTIHTQYQNGSGPYDVVTYSPCRLAVDTLVNTSAELFGWTWTWTYDHGQAISSLTNNVVTMFSSPGTDTLVLVADSGNCTLQFVKVISVLDTTNINCRHQVTGINASISGNTTICPGGQSILTANATGGTGSYNYVWSTSATSQSITVSSAGSYSVTVSDGTNQAIATTNVTPSNVCDSVWPGDANLDGVADANDVLQIGIEYGSTGPIRTGATTFWTPQACNNWSGITYGINDKHADCNGNGLIDANDTVAVSINFGQTHLKANDNASASDPILTLVPSSDTVVRGNSFDLKVMLGSATNTIDSLYGIAFSLNIDQTLFENTASLTMTNSWLGNTTNAMTFRELLPIANEGVIVLTRTDHHDATGYGQIATLTLKAKDPLPAGVTSMAVNFTPAVIKGITSNNHSRTYNVQSGTLTLVKDAVSGIDETGLSQYVTVYPNPSNGKFLLSIAQASRQLNIELMDIHGWVILAEQLKDAASVKREFDLSSYAKGIYLLKLSTENGSAVKRIVVE